MLEHLKQKAGDDACDTDEEVDDDEEYVGSTRLIEHKGCGVHHRGDGPSVNTTQATS